MNARRMKVVELGVVCLALMVAARPCRADAASDRRIFDKLLLAIEANDYDGFLADGNDGFKASLTKQALEGVSGQLSPRLKKGYDCAYAGELMQKGCRVLLWRMTFKDGGDDLLAKLVLKDGKVAGIWLQ